MGYPVVLEMHADVAGEMGAWWLRQFWKAKGRKVMTVTVSALKNALERSTKLQLRPERSRRMDASLLVAPNGVELEKYDGLPSPTEARHQLNLKDGLTVGFTGHIYPGRGADLLFELAKQMPQVNFLWVGGTPELVDFWRARLTEAKMINVTMTGFVKHEIIPLYQAASDVLLMPYSRSISASSGQDIAEVINPMKMFEYMASGRAIVSADLPSIREVLNEGNAVLCSAGELGNWESVIKEWKAAIESLLADEPRRQVLSSQARKDVEQELQRAKDNLGARNIEQPSLRRAYLRAWDCLCLPVPLVTPLKWHRLSQIAGNEPYIANSPPDSNGYFAKSLNGPESQCPCSSRKIKAFSCWFKVILAENSSDCGVLSIADFHRHMAPGGEEGRRLPGNVAVAVQPVRSTVQSLSRVVKAHLRLQRLYDRCFNIGRVRNDKVKALGHRFKPAPAHEVAAGSKAQCLNIVESNLECIL
jgi:hypothetical protein